MIRLHPYRATLDLERYIVENLATGEFFEMPEAAVQAMDFLQQGVEPSEVEQNIRTRFPEEEIDMGLFVRQLAELGFIIVNEEAAVGREVSAESPQSGWTALLAKLGDRLFQSRMWIVYSLFITANIAIFIAVPHKFPNYRDLFPFDSMLLNTVISLIISSSLLILHEGGHVLAARSFGLSTKFRFGHRLIFIVLETELQAIWRLPRKARNIPYLAGLFMDHSMLLLCLMISFVPNVPPWLEASIGIAIFHLVVMSIYQCMFFMKTDLYHVFANMTGCYHVMENAVHALFGSKFLQRSRGENIVFSDEVAIVRMYIGFYVAGMLIFFVVLAKYGLPQAWYALHVSLTNLLHPPSAVIAVDAAIFLLLFAATGGFLLYSWLRKPNL